MASSYPGATQRLDKGAEGHRKEKEFYLLRTKHPEGIKPGTACGNLQLTLSAHKGRQAKIRQELVLNMGDRALKEASFRACAGLSRMGDF